MTRLERIRARFGVWWYWFGDIFGCGGLLVLALVGCVVAIVLGSRSLALERAETCAKLMTYARSPRDTLDVLIACERAKAEANAELARGVQTGAIIGAAAAAGAAASSRPYMPAPYTYTPARPLR